MFQRLPLLLLASLLLFGQLASSALQLCLEEDGSVTVELTLLDCGTVEVPKVPHEAADHCSGTEHSELASSYLDLCLDFCFSLNLRKASSARDSMAAFTVRTAEVQPLVSASIWAALDAANPHGFGTETRGLPAPPWLEHGEMLAKIHAREPVVMRC